MVISTRLQGQVNQKNGSKRQNLAVNGMLAARALHRFSILVQVSTTFVTNRCSVLGAGNKSHGLFNHHHLACFDVPANDRQRKGAELRTLLSSNDKSLRTIEDCRVYMCKNHYKLLNRSSALNVTVRKARKGYSYRKKARKKLSYISRIYRVLSPRYNANKIMQTLHGINKKSTGQSRLHHVNSPRRNSTAPSTSTQNCLPWKQALH